FTGHTPHLSENLTLDLSAAPDVTLSGGMLTLGSATLSVFNSAGNTATLNLGLSDGGGGGALAKTGAGTLILDGYSQHIGLTNVAAGTLLVNGGHPSPLVSVASGATLGGRGSVNGNVIVHDGGTLSPGS